MQLNNDKLRNWILFVAALALILCTIGAAGIVGWLFATGQTVNAILIGFVAFALGQLFNMVSHALGFNQALNVTPLATDTLMPTLATTAPAQTPITVLDKPASAGGTSANG